MRENEAIEWLSRKMSDEGYLTIPQVANGTGTTARRTADAVMVQTWPSRVLSLTGVEYKRSRADWRRELRNPEKAEPVSAYCDFWLLLAPKDVIPKEEVPTGWGLFEIDDRLRLCRTKRPTKLRKVKKLDLCFVAAILRAAEKVNRSESTISVLRAELEKDMEKRIADRVKMRTREHENLLEAVRVFEEASGLDIRSRWTVERLGKGLQEYLKDPDRFRNQLQNDQRLLKRLLETIEEVLTP